MAKDFIQRTKYKRTREESSLIETIWDGTELPRNRNIVVYLEEKVANTPYELIDNGVKMMLSNCRLQIKDAKMLSSAILNGAMQNSQLLKSNITYIEDMVPFMGDDEIEALREPLTNYYQTQYELSHLAVLIDGGKRTQYYNSNIKQLYFLHKIKSPLLNQITQDNLINSRRGYLGVEQLEPLATKQELLTFMRQSGEDILYKTQYVYQVTYDYWVADEDKLTILRQHFMKQAGLDPNYILRNGYLNLGVAGVVKVLISNYWKINPYLAKESKTLMDERLETLIQKTNKRLNKLEQSRESDIKTRYLLIMTMVYLTVYGVGDYSDWIKELAYTG